jgi:opacity protein-like surface antigen
MIEVAKVRATVLALGLVVPAAASAGDWDGLYGGVFVGGGGGLGHSDEVNGPRSYWPTTRGATAVAVAGWQRQEGRMVGGIEAEAGMLGLSGSSRRAVTGGTIEAKTSLGAYGALSARAGVLAMPDLLIFGKAGIAVAALDATTTQTCTGPSFCGGAQTGPTSRASTDKPALGYTLGAGVEKTFEDRWSVRAEYQYVSFSDQLALPKGSGPGWHQSADAHLAKLGVVRRF